jgi:competence protein ComEA
VVILTQEEAALLKASGTYPLELSGQERADEGSGLVNINTATVTELTGVSGIGESRAQAIIDYREKNGAFRSIEDIKKVEGIKDGLFSKIKDKIKI